MGGAEICFEVCSSLRGTISYSEACYPTGDLLGTFGSEATSRVETIAYPALHCKSHLLGSLYTDFLPSQPLIAVCPGGHKCSSDEKKNHMWLA